MDFSFNSEIDFSTNSHHPRNLSFGQRYNYKIITSVSETIEKTKGNLKKL